MLARCTTNSRSGVTRPTVACAGSGRSLSSCLHARPIAHPRAPVLCRATGDDEATASGSDSDFESLFSKELKRRGMSMDSLDDAGTTPKQAASSAQPTKQTPFQASAGASIPGSAGARPRPPSASGRTPPPQSRIADELDGQRARSIGIVNEGLGGLIPRVLVLFQLGGSVFLGFLPFMLAFSILFTGVWVVFGDSFLHSGTTVHATYLDPEALLSAPTVDGYVQFRNR
ncbi:hypothetical protein FOA52_009728 [Chlamydomonas sp. UWO 241]|nr:hypothetical protein FOA52_009728 [Chlamydomonas sp. UWO 241]